MYSIPVTQDLIDVDNLGDEYNKIFNIELSNGMILPINGMRNYYTGNKQTKYFTDGGLENQDILFKNNFNPNEESRNTQDQYEQMLFNSATLRQPVTEEDRQIDQYTRISLDPRIREGLIEEAKKNHQFNFSTESQDFVDQIRDSIRAYNKEDNLYDPNVNRVRTIGDRDLPRTGLNGVLESVEMHDGQGNKNNIKSDFVNAGLEYLENRQREERDENAKQERIHRRYFPIPQKTQEQRLYDKLEIPYKRG